MRGFKIAIPGPVSTALKNPSLDFKKYFCFRFLAKVNLERISFRVKSGKITVCFSSKSRNVIVCIDS